MNNYYYEKRIHNLAVDTYLSLIDSEDEEILSTFRCHVDNNVTSKSEC